MAHRIIDSNASAIDVMLVNLSSTLPALSEKRAGILSPLFLLPLTPIID